MIRCVSCCLTVATLLMAPSRLTAQSDSAQVVGTLSRMLTAMYAKDEPGLRAELDSAARMTLLRPTPSGVLRLAIFSGEQFAQLATAAGNPPLEEPIRIRQMTIDGDLATVWAEYQVRLNGEVSHCGYDAFHLVRRSGAWKILNVSDTLRREGCGPVWTTATIDPASRRRPGGGDG